MNFRRHPLSGGPPVVRSEPKKRDGHQRRESETERRISICYEAKRPPGDFYSLARGVHFSATHTNRSVIISTVFRKFFARTTGPDFQHVFVSFCNSVCSISFVIGQPLWQHIGGTAPIGVHLSESLARHRPTSVPCLSSPLQYVAVSTWIAP